MGPFLALCLVKAFYDVFNPSPAEPGYVLSLQCVSRSVGFFRSQLVWLIVLGFNNTSILVGHFVSSPREREKRDRRDSTGDKREG